MRLYWVDLYKSLAGDALDLPLSLSALIDGKLRCGYLSQTKQRRRFEENT